MLNYAPDVDAILRALADPTRRSIVERLEGGSCSVSELAEPLPMSLPAVVQHLQVLERSGVITTRKVGRVRTCHLEPKPLETVGEWIAARKHAWERRLDRLDQMLEKED